MSDTVKPVGEVECAIYASAYVHVFMSEMKAARPPRNEAQIACHAVEWAESALMRHRDARHILFGEGE